MPVSRKNQNLPKLWQSIKPQQSVRQFEHTIIQFHNTHRTSIRQLPYVLGKKINLRKLYINVIKRGGYKKVNENNEWEDVLEDLNLPKETTNCELAIQSIYHRYLEDYEREQWNSLSSYPDNYSNNNSDNNSMDISKHTSYISELAIRDKSFLAAFVNDNTPKVFCDYQHIIHSSTRSESGLSCDFKEPTEFTHLKMSLQSGLINEVEFALNTLLIMSNSNHIRFDLRFTGNLVDLMLATVGMCDHVPCSYYEQFKECSWMRECLQFWNNTVEDGVGRIFLIPNIFKISKSEIRRLLQTTDISSSQPDSSRLFNHDNHCSMGSDPSIQRIHLVATVLYNLTNDSPTNSKAVINNFQFLRFIFLSVHSLDPVLRRLGLQTLSRMRFVLYPFSCSDGAGLHNCLYRSTKQHSVDIDGMARDEEDNDDEWFSQFLLDFVHSLLNSENRCDRISALEMVQTLCLIEENHQILNKSLKSSFVATISSQLLVPDIHPLCCALESLVSLSQLGEDMCRRMAMCQALLKILLQFIQIEAQMFGPSAVYKIKTFNHRPPVAMPTYHSLPQIMRFPSNTSLRQPFLSPGAPGSVVNFIDPSIQMQCSPGNITLSVSAANCNSISTHCLSKLPLNNPIKSPQMLLHHHSFGTNSNNSIPNNIIVNNAGSYNGPNNNQSNNTNNIINNQNQSSNIQSYKTSQLTPLQQIDQLLTKSIASFENPTTKKEDTTDEEEKRKREKLDQLKEASEGPEHLIDSKLTIGEKRVLKINSFKDSHDYETGEINGAKKSPEREITAQKTEPVAWTSVTTNASNQPQTIVNGNDIGPRSTLNGLEGPTSSVQDNKQKHRNYMNGTLEIDATSYDDPDRRQMPPPSLPTPSMLKKQMRPKLSPPSQLGVANGYLQQLNSKVKRKLVSEMTLTTNAQIVDRCDRAKSWLKQHYQFSDDSKVFVLKQDLVNELHEFLFEDNNDDVIGQASKRIFSAHELHSCIKDVFGHKVQVKVEHRLNGKSQLIYSNLSRITQFEHEKVIPNGVVNSLVEMNGFIHHPVEKKQDRLNHEQNEHSVRRKSDDKSKLTPPQVAGQTNCVPRHQTPVQRTKRLRKLSYPHRKKVSMASIKARRKLLLARKIKLRVSMKFQPKLYKMSINSAPTSTSGDSSTTTSSPPILESQQFLSQNNETHTNDTYPAVVCQWGSCTQRFPDDNSLNFHLTNDHIPISTENSSSPPRTICQWQHCLTASVPRAPLSLLSHVIQEHCFKSNQSTFQSQNATPHRLNNPMPYNIASPPTIHPSMSPNHFGQISEKSGWSVLYDHFRMNEQMQPNLPEGPITKHIRISSSIILRNMSRHSIITKEFLKNNENLLSNVAMSNQDCAPIIVQCLNELALAPTNDS